MLIFFYLNNVFVRNDFDALTFTEVYYKHRLYIKDGSSLWV